MMFSRVGMAVTSVLNNSQLLRHTPDQFRGRVFATMESLRWSVMIVSMAAAGIASQYVSPRTIGLVAGAFGALTAIAWAWSIGAAACRSHRRGVPRYSCAALDSRAAPLAGPGSYSKLIRSRSTTSGRLTTCVWMEPMYSPMIPTEINWTELKKKIPITSGATPTEKRSQYTSL